MKTGVCQCAVWVSARESGSCIIDHQQQQKQQQHDDCIRRIHTQARAAKQSTIMESEGKRDGMIKEAEGEAQVLSTSGRHVQPAQPPSASNACALDACRSGAAVAC